MGLVEDATPAITGERLLHGGKVACLRRGSSANRTTVPLDFRSTSEADIGLHRGICRKGP